jgi:2-polyprenyl-3-methyl-5-hydroxy-6-metoxy-1,4-benzoquinol methylase
VQPKVPEATPSTAGTDYAERLTRLSGQSWKKRLDVQAPYRANIHRLTLGRTLDVGCGIGRNLAYLNADSVGVDHNPHSIEVARERGLTAYTTEQFQSEPPVARPGQFDSLLAAHVVEHVRPDEAVEIIASYLPYVRAGGRVVLICPQEAGYKSDATHVTFVDFDQLRELSARLGLQFQHEYSFPFARRLGRIFRYNEFVHVSRKPDA